MADNSPSYYTSTTNMNVTLATCAVLAAVVAFLVYRRSGTKQRPSLLSDAKADQVSCSSLDTGRLVTLNLLLCFILMVETTIIIPDSLDLVKLLLGEHSATQAASMLSGLVVSGIFAFEFVGCIIASRTVCLWSQREIKKSMLMALTMHLLLTMLCALSISPLLGAAPSTTRMGLLLGSRLAISATEPFYSLPLVLLIQRTLPAKQVVGWQVERTFAISVGIAGGPMLASAVFLCSGNQDAVDVPASLSFLPIVALQLLLLASIFFVVPEDASHVQELKDIKQWVDELDTLSPPTPLNPSSEGLKLLPTDYVYGDETVTETQVNVMLVLTLLVSFCRAAIVSSLEVATSCVLETEFNLPVSSIGIAVGATFVLGLPLSIAVNEIRQAGWIRPSFMMIHASVIGMAAAALIFPTVGQKLGGGNLGASMWILLLADVVMFSMAYLVNGVTSGIALKHVRKTGWFTATNYVLGQNLIEGTLARLVSPPFAREILGIGGRTLYAPVQLFAFALPMFLAVMHIAHTARELDKRD